jgi:hypothetical protein
VDSSRKLPDADGQDRIQDVRNPTELARHLAGGPGKARSAVFPTYRIAAEECAQQGQMNALLSTAVMIISTCHAMSPNRLGPTLS